MKKFNCDDIDGNFTLAVGTDREIRSLYKNMEKHGFMPTFADTPKFRNDSMYGITLEDGKYQVVNSDTIVRFLAKGAL